VKHDLRQKHYVRYCDDFVIVTERRSDALRLITQIEGFLAEHLKLTLHPDKIHIRTWTQGIDFLGYVLPYATMLRPKTAKRMVVRVEPTNACSYFGFCDHADAYDLRRLMKNKIGGSINNR